MAEVVTGKMVIFGVIVAVVVVRFDERDEVDAAWPEVVVVRIDVDCAETCRKRDEERRRHDRRPSLMARGTMFEGIQPLTVLVAAGYKRRLHLDDVRGQKAGEGTRWPR